MARAREVIDNDPTNKEFAERLKDFDWFNDYKDTRTYIMWYGVVDQVRIFDHFHKLYIEERAHKFNEEMKKVNVKNS